MNFNNFGKKYLILSHIQELNIDNNQSANIKYDIFKINHKDNNSTIFNVDPNVLNKQILPDISENPNLINTTNNQNKPNDINNVLNNYDIIERMTSGIYFDDLISLKALQDDRELLNKLGMDICPTDTTLIIKDKINNDIKAAISISNNKTNIDKHLEIKYIDVDYNDHNISKVLNKMNDVSGFIQYYENINLTRIPINRKYIKN